MLTSAVPCPQRIYLSTPKCSITGPFLILALAKLSGICPTLATTLPALSLQQSCAWLPKHLARATTCNRCLQFTLAVKSCYDLSFHPHLMESAMEQPQMEQQRSSLFHL